MLLHSYKRNGVLISFRDFFPNFLENNKEDKKAANLVVHPIPLHQRAAKRRWLVCFLKSEKPVDA